MIPEEKHAPLTDAEMSNAEIFGLITPGITHSSYAKHDDVRRIARDLREARRLLQAVDREASDPADERVTGRTLSEIHYYLAACEGKEQQ